MVSTWSLKLICLAGVTYEERPICGFDWFDSNFTLVVVLAGGRTVGRGRLYADSEGKHYTSLGNFFPLAHTTRKIYPVAHHLNQSRPIQIYATHEGRPSLTQLEHGLHPCVKTHKLHMEVHPVYHIRSALRLVLDTQEGIYPVCQTGRLCDHSAESVALKYRR